MGVRTFGAATLAVAAVVCLLPSGDAQVAASKGKTAAAKAAPAKATPGTSKAAGDPATEKAVVDRYCVGCHNDKLKTGGQTFEHVDFVHPAENAEVFEKVIRKLGVGEMPPQGMPRPAQAELDGLVTYLATSIDRSTAEHPNPGRLSMHRLNRAEYANAVDDLLGLKVDSAALLPPDDESVGFDNIADVLRMSPSLMERYLSASWNVSRLAVGNMSMTPTTTIYRARGDLSQDQPLEGMPLGSHGGIRADHNFPLDGEYIVKVRMWRNTFDFMKGVDSKHTVDVTLDGQLVKTVTFGGDQDLAAMALNSGEFGRKIDEALTIKVPVKAGVHAVETYIRLRSHAQLDDQIKPFERQTVDGLDITGDPAMDRMSVEGPFQQTGVSETASRKKIFACRPQKDADELPCARQILTTLARQAYRRPVTDQDMETLLGFYQRGKNTGGNFDRGIESAIQLILASPEFLVRFEPDPDGIAPNTVYRVNDLELASRLSFFLWSTIPDEDLMKQAAAKKLHEPVVLKAELSRMVGSPKSEAIVDNFAEEWLFLRNLKNSNPAMEQFPDFDDNLRQAMRQETRMFFESIMHQDRSVLDLLDADYTFVNQRLAEHYGIPGVYGSQFRRISVTDPARRGLLGQASILTVTSYPNRTSAVQRGKWILTNLLGVPPSPPPPGVPALKENSAGGTPQSLRARMEMHRKNEPCAGCHKVMDPVGFALENFDGTGRWRASDDGTKIDPSGVMFDGTKVDGVVGLREMILKRPQVFVGVMTEKLLTYALGRPLTYQDMPAVRKIVAGAAKENYRFSALVAGIVDSVPFQMRVSASKTGATGGQ